MKVFARLFQKAAQWRLRKPPRPSQGAKNAALYFALTFTCRYTNLLTQIPFVKMKIDTTAFLFVS